MAKKKSLKGRIDELVDALGRAEKPTFADIRNELVSIGGDVEALERAQALAEKDARIANLEAELSDLQVAVKQANGELERFRHEEKNREEKKWDLPTEQIEILKFLPSEHGGNRPAIPQIAMGVGIPVDEAEVHIKRLEKLGLANRVAFFWYRSDEGNEVVYAMRLAGGGDATEAPQQEIPDQLSQAEDIVLAIVGKADGVTPLQIAERYAKALPVVGKPIMNEKLALLLLIQLRELKMVTADNEGWKVLPKGVKYLAQRGGR
jgi:hypothetical protein